jgi:WD40 repeat protein
MFSLICQCVSPITSVAFAPDGKSILTGSEGDSALKLWSLNGRLLRTFTGDMAPIDRIIFAPDGKSILIKTQGGEVKLWDLSPDHYLAATCAHLNDFAQGSSNPNLPEASRQLRERARRACEGVPISTSQLPQRNSSKSPRIGGFRGPMQGISAQNPSNLSTVLGQLFSAIGVHFTKGG